MPFRVDLEFGNRLETMEVERVEVDPEIESAALSPGVESSHRSARAAAW